MIELGQNIGRQPLANLATNSDALNKMADVVNTLRRLKFDQNFSVHTIPGGGLFVGLRPSVASVGTNDGATFFCSCSGATVTVTAGTFRLHGIGNYRVEPDPDNNPGIAGTVVLAGTPDWVYAWIYRDHTAWGIDHMATEPTSDTNIFSVPLAKYALDSTGAYYMIECCHKYDVNIDAPIR